MYEHFSENDADSTALRAGVATASELGPASTVAVAAAGLKFALITGAAAPAPTWDGRMKSHHVGDARRDS